MNSNPLNTEWLRLVAYGKHPFAGGVQVFDLRSAKKLVETFHSFWQRLLRGFKGLPIYRGHPDVPEYRGLKAHQDRRIYGRILALEAREDALWMEVEWQFKNPSPFFFLKDAYFSPYWLLESEEKHAYRPIRLISVGLTDTPNIPGPSIANQRLSLLEKSFVPAFALKTKSETSKLRFFKPQEAHASSKAAFLKSVKASLRPDLEPYASSWVKEKVKQKDHYTWMLS